MGPSLVSYAASSVIKCHTSSATQVSTQSTALTKPLPDSFHAVVQRQLVDGSVVTLVDMKQIPNGPSFLGNLVRNYEAVRKKIYSERLTKFQKDLTPEQQKIADAQEAEASARSLFVVLTKNDPAISQPEYLGGARVVLAQGSEKLPFEVDPTLNIQRKEKEGISAEVGRLTVITQENAETQLRRSLEIIRLALQALYNHSEVHTIYVHTSKVHRRLYRSIGLNTDQVYDIDKENQVLVFDRQYLVDFLGRTP